MREDFRYEAALSAAIDLLHKLEKRPQMPRHERLAAATFRILDAIGHAERLERSDGSMLGRKVPCPGCGHPGHAPETVAST